MRSLFISGLCAALIAPVQATTLLQLSLDDMIRQSTTIVRGKAQITYSAFHGSMIYTHYNVQITETLKGAAASQIEAVVPGGVSGKFQQSYAGAPVLQNGQEYVLFLWTSKSGLTQIIGLSQGMFAVTANASGQPVVVRAAATERMLDGSGQPVTDSDVQMLLSDLRTHIQAVLSVRGNK